MRAHHLIFPLYVQSGRKGRDHALSSWNGCCKVESMELETTRSVYYHTLQRIRVEYIVSLTKIRGTHPKLVGNT